MRDFREKRSNTRTKKLWLFIKIVMFCISFAGFAYQGMEFLRYYWSYPTVLDIRIEKNRNFTLPAYTFCNANVIQRSKFCEAYPHKCELYNETSELCVIYPHYCEGKDNQSLLPQMDIFFKYYPFTFEDLQTLGQNVTSFLRYSDEFLRGFSLEGPMIFKDFGLQQDILCYSIHARQIDSRDPDTKFLGAFGEKGDSLNTLHATFAFDVFPDETFYPWISAGVYFHIHCPFEAMIPSYEGILLKTGTENRIHMTLKEEYLLPQPYDTDCFNYTAAWESRNRTGPRSARMCVRQCATMFELKCFGCVTKNNRYQSPSKCKEEPFYFEGCFKENVTRGELLEEYRNCATQCKQQCLKLSYPYTVTEVNLKPRLEYFLEEKRNRLDMLGRRIRGKREHIRVKIFIDEPEVFVLRHKPKYQDVELFSSMGGFLGCWLGISLFAFADILKSASSCIMLIIKGHKNRSASVQD